MNNTTIPSNKNKNKIINNKTNIKEYSSKNYINITKPKPKAKFKNNDNNIKPNKNNHMNYNINNKRKINIINLANKEKYKNPNRNKFDMEDSDSSNTNSFILDSELISKNKISNYMIRKKNKNDQGGNTLLSSANESCNIQESEISKLSISGFEAKAAGKIKYI